MSLSMILAVSDDYGIGKDNKLPWDCKSDMKWFVEKTKNAIVVMGSNTWDSLPTKPLKNRTNIVLSKRYGIQGADSVIDLPPVELNSLFKLISKIAPEKEIILIGGANVYTTMFPFVDRVYLSRIHVSVECDAFLRIDDMMGDSFELEFSDSSDSTVTFEIWKRK